MNKRRYERGRRSRRMNKRRYEVGDEGSGIKNSHAKVHAAEHDHVDEGVVQLGTPGANHLVDGGEHGDIAAGAEQEQHHVADGHHLDLNLEVMSQMAKTSAAQPEHRRGSEAEAHR